MHHGNVALTLPEMHNNGMPLGFVFGGFLSGVMVGAGSVFALLLAVGVGMPGRTAIRVIRRTGR